MLGRAAFAAGALVCGCSTAVGGSPMQLASSALARTAAAKAAPSVAREILSCVVGMATGKLTLLKLVVSKAKL